MLERGALALLAERAQAFTSWRVELVTAGLGPGGRPFLEEAVRRVLCGIGGRGQEPPWSTVKRVVELTGQPAGTRVHGPEQPLVERLRDGLLFVDPGQAGAPPSHAVALEFDGGVHRFGTTEWCLEAAAHSCGPAPTAPTADRWRVWLDPTDAPAPWSLRRRRAGDRFWPLGMPGPVDLRGFLRGRHVPRFDRDRMPLVVDRGDQVVWIPGVEIDHRARRRAGTGRCVELWATRQNTGGATAAAEPY